MADGTVVIEILGDTSKYMQAVSGLSKRTSDALGSAGSALSGWGAGLTAAVPAPLAAAGAAAAKWALDAASAAEQADIAFSTMLGPERAKRMLSDLAEFARTTPFEMAGLTSATQKLLAYGFAADDVIPLLESVGNATAGLGAGQEGIDAVTRALGQMQAKGKVMSEEMLQLTEVGIPAWEYLAEAVSGGDVQAAMEMVTAGAVDAGTAIAALQAGMDRDFGGLMERQSQTLAGSLSNLKDSVADVARSIKDTEGYQMLSAAVRRLSDSVGPLAEKLLPMASDALEVAAGGVDALASAVDGMDQGDVEAVVRGLVGAASAGPALLAAGKACQALSGAMSLVSKVSGGASKGLAEMAKGAKAGVGQTEGLAQGLGALLSKVSPLHAAIGALAVGGIAFAATQMAEAERRAETMRRATEDLSAACGVAEPAAQGAADAIGSVGEASGSSAESVDRMYESQAQLADQFEQINDRVSAETGQLQSMKQAISEYAGQTSLTSVEQGRLIAAVEQLNEVTGENYQVVQDSSGAYVVMKDGAVVAKEAIFELIDAQIAQVQQQGQLEKLDSLYAQQADDAKAYADQLRKVQKVQEQLDKLDPADSNYSSTKSTLEANLETETARLDELREGLDRTNGSIEEVEGSIASAEAVASGASDSVYDLANSNQTLAAALEGTGRSTDDFARALEDTGISTEQFGSLSQDQLMQLAATWDGTTGDLVGKLQEMGVELEETSATMRSSLETMGGASEALSGAGIGLDEFSEKLVAAGVSSADLSRIGSESFASLAANCGGNIDLLTYMVQNYNDLPILDKNGNVMVQDGQLVDAQGNVYEWNGTALVSKGASAQVSGNAADGSAERAVEGTQDAIDGTSSKSVSVNVSGNYASAADLIGRLGSSISNLASKAVSVVANVFGFARGGVRPHADGGVADARGRGTGFIATGPTFVSDTDVIGEDGAEAYFTYAGSDYIVPLTNEKYALPFAQLVARETASLVPAAPDASAIAAAVESARLAAPPSASAVAAAALPALQEQASVGAWGARGRGDLASVERRLESIERALGAPVEIRYNRREFGRMVREVS